MLYIWIEHVRVVVLEVTSLTSSS
ncbi:hypothetical protein DFA_00020 [Cavenderia fasciculata]|uniref:Uncharacterized protein n=1 Tax=Cavenderia fasciculata TaxID=261658 RepID=F4PXD3_CACFS|nr:hypothetical protein DFA_00020 [Cavenderia fasciculata]EGG19443.1 hypothetical protein DFA_00020 [Cavenderia fasciculata]|eukprot:XP_004357737.1 hypothetical protein DFA_00020 [Cavenderia fasciculata]